MPGRVPGIHDFDAGRMHDVDGRDERGHDGGQACVRPRR